MWILHLLSVVGATAGAFVGWAQYSAELMPAWAAVLSGFVGALVPYAIAFLWAGTMADTDD